MTFAVLSDRTVVFFQATNCKRSLPHYDGSYDGCGVPRGRLWLYLCARALQRHN